VTVAAATVARGALLVASGVIPTPHVGTFLADTTSSIGGWMYVVVAALAFLETAAFVGLLGPGEMAVVVGGVAAAEEEVELLAMIASCGSPRSGRSRQLPARPAAPGDMPGDRNARSRPAASKSSLYSHFSCRRRDSNPRHADYDSVALWLCTWV
jgi:hypothetical protein